VLQGSQVWLGITADAFHERGRNDLDNILHVVLHEIKLLSKISNVVLHAERQRPQSHGVHVIARAVRGDAGKQQPRHATHQAYHRLREIMAILHGDEDQSLENLPERIQMHGGQPPDPKEIRVRLLTQCQPIIDAVEIRATAEVLEREELIVERYARHHVVAVDDAEVLPRQPLRGVRGEVLVPNARLPERVDRADLAGDLGLAGVV